MHHDETPRSFPQPSRKFDGDYLDPMLVEEDFEETVGITRRFARGRDGFTEEQILAHLAANGVVLYGTQEDWEVLFAEMREQMVADGTKKKPPVEVGWIEQEIGGVATFAMVEVTTVAQPEPAQTFVPEVSKVEVREQPDEVRDEADEIAPFTAITEILQGTAEGKMRPKELATTLAWRLKISPEEAADLLDAALLAEQVIKVGSRGTTFIMVSNGKTESKRRGPDRQVGAETTEERPLTEDELTMVVAVLDKLAEGHVTTGATIKNLERQLKSTFSRDQFRRLLRVLESQRLIRFDSDAKYGQARKSPRVHLRGQDTKNRWQANRDGYIARLKKTKIH